MNATLLAVVLSLFSAVAYAAAAVAQERLASRDPGSGMLRMLSSGAWWGSVGLNASAALLHVVALKYGPLTVVQPLGALTLVAAVPLGARVAGPPGQRRGVAGHRATPCSVSPRSSSWRRGPAPDQVLTVPEALMVAGATATLIGVLARPRRPPRPAARDRVRLRLGRCLRAHPDGDGGGDGPLRARC